MPTLLLQLAPAIKCGEKKKWIIGVKPISVDDKKLC